MSHPTRRNIFGAAQRIETIHENPCDAPWWVYLKTAVPAIGSSLYMLIIPTPDEILEEYIDPSKTRGRAKRGFQGAWRRATGGGGGGRRGRRGGFPDPDGLVADRLPGRALFASRRISALEHVFWTGINTTDRFLFYWLVYDAGLNFVYEWHSGILESSCDRRALQAAGHWSRTAGSSPDLSQWPMTTPYWDEAYLYGAKHAGEGWVQLETEMVGTLIWTHTFDAYNYNDPKEVNTVLTLSNPTDGKVLQERQTSIIQPQSIVTHHHIAVDYKVVDIVAEASRTLGSQFNQYGNIAFTYRAEA